MGKQDQGSASAEGARRATGGAAGRGRGGRFSVGRKSDAVMRLLRGEDLETVSRELGVTAARVSPGLKGPRAGRKFIDGLPTKSATNLVRGRW